MMEREEEGAPLGEDRKLGRATREREPTRNTAGAAPASLRVLVVDDEQNIRRTLALCLRDIGCEVEQAASGAAAVELLRRRSFDLAFLDLRLEKESGLDLIPRFLAERPGLDVVMITAYASVDSAVEAMRRGAKDYLPKPFTPAQIRALVERTAERRALEHRVTTLEARLEGEPPARLETRSPRMQQTLQLLERAAQHDVPVLLRGETGTGKGALAHALHARSARRDRPFEVVKCAAVPAEQLAGAIFGSARGAAAGAARDRGGGVEAAEGGTLFLDEVGEASLDVQARLLRLIQEKAFERVGEARVRAADVRVVAATSRELEADVKAGRFRQELLYCLNVMEIPVPPLRDRAEDVLPLAREHLAAVARRANRPVPALSRAAERALTAYGWPGNVQELRNTIERALIVAPGSEIEPEAFPERITAQDAASATLGGDFTAEQIEREHILRVLARSAKLEEASRILGIDVTTLWRKRKRWGR
jgi:NtrC-family two-component system response regulator AlgB